MTSRAFRGGVLVAVSGVLAVMAGCVDDDPVISGHRPVTDGGVAPSEDAGPSIPIINTLVPVDDFDGGGDVDDPLCRHCSTTLDTDQPRGTLCRHNDVAGTGKSSVQTLNALVSCLCYDKCPAKCGNYCSGGRTDLVCSACITQGCSEFISACQADL